jgi:putative ABC transport system substrate-binding protein
MKKRFTLVTLCALLFALCVPAEAQQPTKVPRIGFLTNNSPTTFPAGDAAFLLGLRELGYIEGKSIIIEWRYGEGKPGQLQEMLKELIRSDVAVIVTGGPAATRLAKQSKTTIPVVMATDPDPVANGFVASLARPGGRITGLSTLAPEIAGKRLELLKEIVPSLSRVAVFGTSSISNNAQLLRESELAAKALGVKLQYFDILSRKDIETAFTAAKKERAEAVLQLVGVVLNSVRKETVELEAKNRLPAIFPWPEFVEAGGLMSYGVQLTELHHRAATYVDKILKGAKPADLPVEQPTKFELVINLKTAKQIGLTIPPTVLARADRVIK